MSASAKWPDGKARVAYEHLEKQNPRLEDDLLITLVNNLNERLEEQEEWNEARIGTIERNVVDYMERLAKLEKLGDKGNQAHEDLMTGQRPAMPDTPSTPDSGMEVVAWRWEDARCLNWIQIRYTDEKPDPAWLRERPSCPTTPLIRLSDAERMLAERDDRIEYLEERVNDTYARIRVMDRANDAYVERITALEAQLEEKEEEIAKWEAAGMDELRRRRNLGAEVESLRTQLAAPLDLVVTEVARAVAINEWAAHWMSPVKQTINAMLTAALPYLKRREG